jgi:predicted N-formylglutamate amidohydrolase
MTESAQEHYEIRNAGAAPNLLFLCDHAANAVPTELGTLGLSLADFQTHIAYDIGAAPLARALADRFGAPAILARWSRLLVDLNRGTDDPTVVMKLSDGRIIPQPHADESGVGMRVSRFSRLP